MQAFGAEKFILLNFFRQKTEKPHFFVRFSVLFRVFTELNDMFNHPLLIYLFNHTSWNF